MDTNVGNFLQLSSSQDPSWKRAAQVVGKHLPVPTHVWNLFKTAWQASADAKDFIKVMGFSRLKLQALLSAAELRYNGSALEAALIEQALQTLGARLSAVVLAVNYTCGMIINTKPTRVWRTLFETMMTDIEIGYRFGAKSSLGLEGGVLIGFATQVGKSLLLADNAKTFREWYNMTKSGVDSDKQLELEVFGCEPYQVAALAVQALGFGHELAVGIACGAGQLSAAHLKLGEAVTHWQAAYQWIEALRDGRNYPAAVEMRQVFPEFMPKAPGSTPSQNMVLETLHTEISKIRSSGSKWVWHLPKASYEETQAMLGE